MKYTMMAAFVAVTLLFAQGAKACTQEEATEKMMKVVQSEEYQTFVSSAKTEEEAQKIADFSGRLSAAGALLSEQKLDEACVEYDALSEELGIEKAAVEE